MEPHGCIGMDRPEKRELTIAFVPIVCSAPLLYADSHGFFAKQGLSVELKRAPGWSGVKELLVHGFVDAAHMLTAMPIACAMGIDGIQAPVRLAMIQNINGQAITLAKKHLGLRHVAEMKGFTFGVPYRFSMHNYLLRHWLAEHGVNPAEDVLIREVAPPRMPFYLEKGWIDGMLAPEPFNQLAVQENLGFIYCLSKDLWPGHPCCSFAVRQDFIDAYPHTYRALLRAILESQLAIRRANGEERKAIAREISGPGYLNLDRPTIVEQVLLGDYPDGRGGHCVAPERIDFLPFPWPEYGSWILSQMQRWGQLAGRQDYRQCMRTVFPPDVWEIAQAVGFQLGEAPLCPGFTQLSESDPESFVRQLPFSHFREEPEPLRTYDLTESARARLGEIVRQMAAVAGGESYPTIEVTGQDEIGLLEQTLNEAILNMRFAREALLEHGEKLQRRVSQRTAELEQEIAGHRLTEEALRLNEARLDALVRLNQMTSASLQEITDFALEAAVRLTRSTIGYLAFLNEDETVLTMHSWSKAAMAECAIIDKPIIYPVVTTGLWGEAVRQRKAVITNDYQADNPLKKGYPEGHVQVLRHMNAPIFDGERIVIVAGVGNKEAPYEESDVRQLTLLMQGMWQLLQRRRSQERLAHLNAVLRAVRNVNQLICRERDRDRLLEGVCQCLVEARGYQRAWAVLYDSSRVPTAWAQAGAGDSWPVLAERIRQGEVFPCIQECLDRRSVVLVDPVRCASAHCPLLSDCEDTDVMATRIQHAAEVYGVLAVTLPKKFAGDAEEQTLVEEVAGDVGFALHGIGLEQQRALAEEGLRQAKDELELRVQERTADLTRANADLELAKQAAEAASRAKSTFLANMSHEIRTPLNGVIGMTELVLKTQLSAQQREFLLTVKDSGEALLSVINDILDFSKIEAGKLVLENSTFNLRESLGDTMKSFALRAHERGLELTCFIHPEIPHMVFGDYSRLRQVVTNLVGNAIKFTDKGEIDLEVVQESRSPHDVVLQFTVSDTGIGIPEEKQSTIFEMFEQADSSTRRRHGGTGLGLAIAAKLLALMDGRIWVESEVGRGSRFHFTARFTLGEQEPAEPLAPEPASLHGMRLLVVDDNATNRRILDEVLRSWKMVPFTVASAWEAMKAIQEAQRTGNAYRLVITDAHMPGIDGFMLAEQIKQDADMKSTVIMMLTSGDRPEDTARCDRLGIAAYLLKPVKQSELLEAIELALGISVPREDLFRSAAQQPHHVPSLHVLLAEDSLVNQKLAVALLEGQGHTVTIAGNGKEAVAATLARKFDLVLMDVQMPEMDGLEAAALIRAREQQTGTHVPIIAMTAHALKGDRERCLAVGMDNYVAKPIRAEELFATIETIFSDRKRDSAAAPSVRPDVVDWTAALKAVQGNRKVLKTIVEAAMEEIPQLLTAIRQAIADGDRAGLELSAHTLKGAVRYFGANGVCDHAARLEVMGRKGELADAEATFAALQEEIEPVTAGLADYLRES